MSVDYNAEFGIGFLVDEIEGRIDEDDLEDGFFDYVYNEVGDGFYVFQIGNLFTGEIEGPYLCVSLPFSQGLDLTAAKNDLIAEADRMGVECLGDFGLVGGLMVW